MGRFSIPSGRPIGQGPSPVFIPQQRGARNNFGEIARLGETIQAVGSEAANEATRIVTGLAQKARQMQDTLAASETALILKSAEDTVLISRETESDPYRWPENDARIYEASGVAIGQLRMSEEQRVLSMGKHTLAQEKTNTSTILAQLEKGKNDALYGAKAQLTDAYTQNDPQLIEDAELNFKTLAGIFTEQELAGWRSEAVTQGQEQWVDNTKEALSTLAPKEATAQAKAMQSQGLLTQKDTEEVIQNAKYNEALGLESKEKVRQAAESEAVTNRGDAVLELQLTDSAFPDDPIDADPYLPMNELKAGQFKAIKSGYTRKSDPVVFSKQYMNIFNVRTGNVEDPGDDPTAKTLRSKPQNLTETRASLIAETVFTDKRNISKKDALALIDADKKVSAMSPSQVVWVQGADSNIVKQVNTSVAFVLNDKEEAVVNDVRLGLVDFVSENPESTKADIDAWVAQNASPSFSFIEATTPAKQGQQITGSVAAEYLQRFNGDKDRARVAAKADGWSF